MALAELIKEKVLRRLELRGLLTDLTHSNIRILGYELMDDLADCTRMIRKG